MRTNSDQRVIDAGGLRRAGPGRIHPAPFQPSYCRVFRLFARWPPAAGRPPSWPILAAAPPSDTLPDMVQSLSIIRELLARHGLRPKHRLGQNFLHDHNFLRKIIHAAGIDTHEQQSPESTTPNPAHSAAAQPPGQPPCQRPLVLEVGPGTGVLSELLLEAGAELVAAEIDEDLIPILQERLEPWKDRATLLHTDILETKNHLAGSVLEVLAGRPFRLVANLPYQVASPLLITLARRHPEMDLAVVMIQQEVADRLTAAPGGDDYGPLTLMIQAFMEVDRVCTLPPACFWPAPKVHSAVIRLRRRSKPLCARPEAFEQMVRLLFQQRRKQIGAILRKVGIDPAPLDPSLRPERLTLAEIDDLAGRFSHFDGNG